MKFRVWTWFQQFMPNRFGRALEFGTRFGTGAPTVRSVAQRLAARPARGEGGPLPRPAATEFRMTDLSSQNWLPAALPEPPKLDEPPVDGDPSETAEWLEALDSLIATQGPERAKYLLDRLAQHARAQQVGWRPKLVTPYRNTIPVAAQPRFPGNLDIEQRIAAIVRGNALAMVVRANKAYGELGGHISSYASAADLFEVGFNHFFRARNAAFGGDL